MINGLHVGRACAFNLAGKALTIAERVLANYIGRMADQVNWTATFVRVRITSC